jgi:hypothetical protein
MLRVDWQRFGKCARANAKVEGRKIIELPKLLGVSRPTLYRAFNGETLQVDQFLTLCHWMQQDPMWFTNEDHPPMTPQGDDELIAKVKRSIEDATTRHFNPGLFENDPPEFDDMDDVFATLQHRVEHLIARLTAMREENAALRKRLSLVAQIIQSSGGDEELITMAYREASGVS